MGLTDPSRRLEATFSPTFAPSVYLISPFGSLQADWMMPPPFENSYPLDLGGVIEMILCMPPRPPYRHLPVHVPNPQQYIWKLKAGKRAEG